MNKLLSFSLFFIMLSCQPQNYDSGNSNYAGGCSKNVSIQYRKSSKDTNAQMIADKSKQTITVFLESHLNGKVQGYIGNKLIFSENVVTEESLGTTGKSFIYDYSNDSVLQKIKIHTESDCLEIKIEKRYKLVYIYNYDGKWDVIYSNVYPTYE